MKPDRYFYSTAAAINLAIMFLGFLPFYTSARGEHGRVIAPGIFPVVMIHGLATTAWYVLSLAQALLIAVKNRRFHMTLGWAAVALLPVVAVSGVMTAVLSVKGAPNFKFFGMFYRDFLLVMITEIAMFTVLVIAGLMMRKRPEIHRALMLLAGLSLLIGATTRMPFVLAPFGGDTTRLAFFGPIFTLAAIYVLVRWAMTRKFDRWLAGGYAVMVVVFLVAEQLSRTDAWRHAAVALLKK